MSMWLEGNFETTWKQHILQQWNAIKTSVLATHETITCAFPNVSDSQCSLEQIDTDYRVKVREFKSLCRDLLKVVNS